MEENITKLISSSPNREPENIQNSQGSKRISSDKNKTKTTSPSTLPKKGHSKLNQDSIKTPVKPFKHEPKTEGYAETKKPENMKKEFEVEVSDFKEDIQRYMENTPDDIERQIAEKLEKRIRNFLGNSEEENGSAFVSAEKQPSTEINKDKNEPFKLESSLEEKCKTITLK